MTAGKAALGKIFISHASADKAWVRRFNKRLQDAGYATWLDEKELQLGDALAEKISEGLRDAKVVAVVVSTSSLASNWLRYELDIATERMIKGHCRLIPVLIDDVEVPPELAGRLYADMRPGKRGGFQRILGVLESEAEKYPAPKEPPSMAAADAWVRRQAYESYLTSLSEGWFSASMAVSAVRDVDFEGFSIQGRDVVVDRVSVHSLHAELAERDYADWKMRVTDELQEDCGLLISELPIADALAQRLGLEDRVAVEETAGLVRPGGALVVADLSEDLTDEHAREILGRAVARLRQAVESAAPPLLDPKDLGDDSP